MPTSMGPSRSEGAALDQLHFLEDTLRRTRQRYAGVHSALLDANLAFEEARRTLSTLTAEAESLNASMVALARDISSQRLEVENASRDAELSRVRRLLARMPCELLRCMFVEAMQPVEDVWRDDELWGRCFYDQRRIPFVLASINRHWREVALLTPQLWTFIGVVPLDNRDGSPYLAYVELMLSRSKRRPLDIFLGWADCNWAKAAHYAQILDAVGRHAHRWRRASITFPYAAPESAFQFLRLPMPTLEDLFLTTAGAESELYAASAPSPYLAFCPSLRRLDNNLIFIVPSAPLASLTYAHMEVDSSSLTEIWTLLGMLPAVSRLGLDFVVDQDGEPSISVEPLTMPHVRQFTLVGWCERFSVCIAQLHMPVLEVLEIGSDTIEIFSPLFDKVAGSLSTLIIGLVTSDDPFPSDYMPHIRKLQKLRNLAFRECSTLGRDFPTVLASRAAAGLPLLESVSVQPAGLDKDSAALISSLMQKLHARSASGADGALVFELSVENNAEVPAWLLQQDKFITTGECDGDSEGSDAVESQAGP